MNNTITYVLEENNYWLKVRNELNHPLHIYTHDKQFQFFTRIEPDETETHPYGMEGIKKINIFIVIDQEEV